MALTFDWKESVRRYVDIYRLAQSKKRVELFIPVPPTGLRRSDEK